MSPRCLAKRLRSHASWHRTSRTWGTTWSCSTPRRGDPMCLPRRIGHRGSCSPPTSTPYRRIRLRESRMGSCTAAAPATPRGSWRRRSWPLSGSAPRGWTGLGCCSSWMRKWEAWAREQRMRTPWRGNAAGSSTASRPITGSQPAAKDRCASRCAPPGSPRTRPIPSTGARRSMHSWTCWWTCVTLLGGTRPNVVAAEARADLQIRLVTEVAPVQTLLERAVRDRARIDYLTAVPPLRLATVPGFESCVVRFTTDIPHLTNWGTPLLLGPGSILDAHSAHERISESELAAGVDSYVRLVHALAVRKAEA